MLTILVDTREQEAYRFEDFRSEVPYKVRRHTLATGDYLVDPFADAPWLIEPERSACVERKSLADLYGTATRGRARFERLLERLRAYPIRALVIEAEWSHILDPNAYLVKPTRMRPRAMLATLIAWQQRYQLPLYTCPGRDAAERITFRLLERWYRDCREEHAHAGHRSKRGG